MTLKEFLEKKKILRDKINAAQSIEELDALKGEMEQMEKDEQYFIQRDAYMQKLNTNPGFVPTPAPDVSNPEANMFDSVEYRQAFMAYICSNGQKEIPAEFRAAGPTKTVDVGAVIPNTIINKIIEKMLASGMILREVTRTNLKGGVSYPISTIKPVASWVAEGAGSQKQKKTVTSITFSYYKLRCAVSVTLETSVEALQIFENALINNVAEAMTMALEKAIIDGDGSGKPKGILTETPTSTITVATNLTYKNMVDAEAELDIAYENNAVYFMTKKTFMGFQGIVDDAGQPIARVTMGLSGKPERTILGRRVVLNNYMESLSGSTEGSTVVAVLFDPKNYVLNTSYNMGMKRYEDNETDDEVMKAIMLVDGKLVDTNSLIFLQTA